MMCWCDPEPCSFIHLSYPFSAFRFVGSLSFCSFWCSSYAATSLKDVTEFPLLNIKHAKGDTKKTYPITLSLKVTKNSHIDVAAKVLEELDLALAEEEAGFEGHRAVQGSVKASQDLSLILRHVSTVFQLKQV